MYVFYLRTLLIILLTVMEYKSTVEGDVYMKGLL
jgi:hypothetical protein